MSNALALNTLRIGLFRFTITPVQSLEVPAVNKTNMLRGGFGHALRRLCCIPQCRDAKACPLVASCPYKILFEPSPPCADRLSKNQDIPRPFVFRAPQTHQTRFEKGERFDFGLVLIGRALDFLPYFVLSFRELAGEGLGLNRAKCTLEKVEEVGVPSNGPSPNDTLAMADRCIRPDASLVYSVEDQIFRAIGSASADRWIKTRLREFSGANGNASVQRLTIRFLTPTFLRADGEVVRRPEFHQLFKRLRDRVNALSTFFGDGPLDVDFKRLGERAEKVRTVAAQTDWVERFRTSSKTRQRHELSGFVGSVTYDLCPDASNLAPVFLPWLALGEVVHVGKHTAWGNGWFEVRSI
jgi:hypothetical protein